MLDPGVVAPAWRIRTATCLTGVSCSDHVGHARRFSESGVRPSCSGLLRPENAVAHGLVVVEVQQVAQLAVVTFLNDGQVPAVERAQLFLLPVQLEAAGHPFDLLARVDHRLHTLTGFEHQLQYATRFQRPRKFAQHPIENHLTRDVLDHSVAENQIEPGILKWERLT